MLLLLVVVEKSLDRGSVVCVLTREYDFHSEVDQVLSNVPAAVVRRACQLFSALHFCSSADRDKGWMPIKAGNYMCPLLMSLEIMFFQLLCILSKGLDIVHTIFKALIK